MGKRRARTARPGTRDRDASKPASPAAAAESCSPRRYPPPAPAPAPAPGQPPLRQSAVAGAGFRFRWQWLLVLAAIFAVCLAARLYGAFTVGFDMDGPDSMQMVNYDEAGSCRSLLGSRRGYPSFVGRQILAIATILGHPPPPVLAGEDSIKAFCQSRSLIRIHRAYSAVTGALTAVLCSLMALFMWPGRPRIAWTAAAVLGFSNLHIDHSHWGTADAPQVFFAFLLITVLTYAVVARRRWPLILSPLLLLAAIWAKLYFFAVFAYAGLLPRLELRRNWRRYLVYLAAVLLLGGLFVWWETDARSFRRYLPYLWGSETSHWGTGFGHIGTWRRWIRNAFNLPLVHIVGLGLPAFVFLCHGVRRALASGENRAAWLTHAPTLAFAIYMLVLAPETPYRHYLALLPTAALLAAYGFWESRWSRKRVLVVLFLVYPLLLALNSEYNYRYDPRRELRAWYASHGDPRLLVSYYVVPPESAGSVSLFDVNSYLRFGRPYLEQADYLLLSEAWYDRVFASEINGPITWKPEWLIWTTVGEVETYRKILSGRDPNLELETDYRLKYVMPEFLLHRMIYGSFPTFLGDLRIYKIK